MKALYTHWIPMTHCSDGYRISGCESNLDRFTIELDMVCQQEDNHRGQGHSHLLWWMIDSSTLQKKHALLLKHRAH
jgi:hypothetical protein